MKENRPLQPTPRDFSEFAYCGVKWILGHFERMAFSGQSERLYYRKIGQQNEKKCIDWVLTKYRATAHDIAFDGTNASDQSFLTSSINSLGVRMQCKPDLILRLKGETNLFEFKAVGDSMFLFYEEFEANHAQVWCYSHLEEYRADRYFLLRYFIDPNARSVYKELPPSFLDDKKFLPLFERYIEFLHVLNEKENKGNVAALIKNLVAEHAPKEAERATKCRSCVYNRKHRCPVFH